MSRYSGGIINYFDSISIEIDEYFKNILDNQKTIQKKDKLTIEEMGYKTFNSIHILCEGEFKDRKRKKHLKFIGIKKLNERCYLEIMIYYLFMATLSIQQSSLSLPLKINLATVMLRYFWTWLEKSNREPLVIEKIDNLRDQRFKEYKIAYHIIFENNNPKDWVQGIYIIFDAFKEVLHPSKSKENIFDMLGLFSFFVNRIMVYTPIFIKEIDQTEIVNK